MGTGTATVLIQCPASRWKGQPSARLVDSAFHDIVWLFDRFCSRIFLTNTNWTMSITQDSVSSRRPPFMSFMTLSLVYELTVWLGDCYVCPSGFRNPLPFFHNLTLLCCDDCNQSAA